MKSFFGGIFVAKEKLEEAGIDYPIKLEYYKRVNDDEVIKSGGNKYGVNIVQTDYFQNETRVEEGEIEFLTNDEDKVEKVLKIFKEGAVTPVDMQYVMDELYKKLF